MSLISISIVSHGHGQLLMDLLSDLAALPHESDIELILTLNIEEEKPLGPIQLPFPYRIIQNPSPKGFGANHNAAFSHSKGQYFCVLNPDVRLPTNPFPALVRALSDNTVGLVAPVVRCPQGALEDSARHFPTLRGLIRKALGRSDGRHDLSRMNSTHRVEWVAGMFMLARSDDLRGVGGFDDGFFLYYEDVDLCIRLWSAGRAVAVCKDVEVIHDAQRQSRVDPKHFGWHLRSMARYFLKHWLRLPKTPGTV